MKTLGMILIASAAVALFGLFLVGALLGIGGQVLHAEVITLAAPAGLAAAVAGSIGAVWLLARRTHPAWFPGSHVHAAGHNAPAGDEVSRPYSARKRPS